jgi:hypothetical protein
MLRSIERKGGLQGFKRNYSCKLMLRVLAKKCDVQTDDDASKVTVKKPKQISADSLQNPYDGRNALYGLTVQTNLVLHQLTEGEDRTACIKNCEAATNQVENKVFGLAPVY